jgi:branched-chain amino acid transport system ATP-binding protein
VSAALDPLGVRDALEVRGLCAGYDGLRVLHQVDLDVHAGEVMAVLGPNGAGKSTLLSTIAGVLAPTAGTVQLFDRSGRAGSVHHRVRHGLGYVPSSRGLFPALTARENLRVRGADRAAVRAAFGWFPRLEVVADRRAGLLSGGEQQMLALAAVLVARPRLLLIDEMSMGLAPLVVRSLLPVIRAVADEDGVAVLLVEQHAPAAVEVSDRVVVLNRGRVVHQASSEVVRDDPAQLTALYLSEAAD